MVRKQRDNNVREVNISQHSLVGRKIPSISKYFNFLHTDPRLCVRERKRDLLSYSITILCYMLHGSFVTYAHFCYSCTEFRIKDSSLCKDVECKMLLKDRAGTGLFAVASLFPYT